MAVKNKALTDEEIIKAFYIVIESKGKDAVFANVDIKKEGSCEYKHIALTFDDILDLLNRQQAELDFAKTINALQMEELQKEQAEIERLNAKIKSVYKELQRIALMTAPLDKKEKEREG